MTIDPTSKKYFDSGERAGMNTENETDVVDPKNWTDPIGVG